MRIVVDLIASSRTRQTYAYASLRQTLETVMDVREGDLEPRLVKPSDGLTPRIRVNLDVSCPEPALTHLLMGGPGQGDASDTFVAMRRACQRPVAVFDGRLGDHLRLEHGVTGVPLLAPALLGAVHTAMPSIAIFLHDGRLAHRDLDLLQQALHRLAPRMDIVVHDDGLSELDDDIGWLLPETRSAICHIHLGHRARLRCHGRLLDSAAAGVPIVTFAGEARPQGLRHPACDPESGLRETEHYVSARSLDDVVAHVARLLDNGVQARRLADAARAAAEAINRDAARQITGFLAEVAQ